MEKQQPKNIIQETCGACKDLPLVRELLEEKYIDNKLEEERERRLFNI